MKIIATNRLVRKLIDKTQSSPTFYKKLNNNLPMIETTVAVLFYSLSINSSKTIEEKRKPSLHYQNWICGGAGILFGSSLNKLINKYKTDICKHLEVKTSIPKLHNVIKGVQVAIPLIIFSSLLRFVIPVISTPISTSIERLRLKHQKIDKKI